MHFIDARDTLMRTHHWSRKIATLAVRLAGGIDTFKILMACEGFHGTPLLNRWETNAIKKYLESQ